VIRAVLLTFLVLFCVAAPAQAARKPFVGFGEQSPFLFSDARWDTLKKNEKHFVRYVMPWDALKYKRTRTAVDFWMNQAQAHRARVMLSFSYSVKRSRQYKVPSNSAYRQQIKAVRKRYPFVKTFQTWNEANQGLQPTFKKPKAAARLYDTLVKTCRGCVVTAPAVLLASDMKAVNWIKAFDRAAKKKVKIWAVHNHIDTNRNTKTGTKNFLRYTKGQVWFTETGAIWNRWIGKRKIKQYNHKTAVRAIRNIFKLQRLNPRRITRIYVYNWFGVKAKRPRWDSGLMNPIGTERTTFKTLKAQMRKYAR
jgi:Glycosyl hydrolase catalytic core